MVDSNDSDDEQEAWNRLTLKFRDLLLDPRTKRKWTKHIFQSMAKKNIDEDQVEQSLFFGVIRTPPRKGERPGLLRFRLDARVEGSDKREIGTVVEVDFANLHMSLVTTMWVDERDTPRGSFR